MKNLCVIIKYFYIKRNLKLLLHIIEIYIIEIIIRKLIIDNKIEYNKLINIISNNSIFYVININEHKKICKLHCPFWYFLFKINCSIRINYRIVFFIIRIMLHINNIPYTTKHCNGSKNHYYFILKKKSDYFKKMFL